MTPDRATRAALLEALPQLRRLADALCRDRDRADDLMQQTFLLAWSNLDSFAPGSNMAGWLFTIMRNRYFSEYRKLRREIADVDGACAEGQLMPPGQLAHLEYEEFIGALTRLPDEMRRAVTLIGVHGYTYEEAAQACHCSVGTMKSRMHRGRTRLASQLAIELRDNEDYGIAPYEAAEETSARASRI